MITARRTACRWTALLLVLGLLGPAGPARAQQSENDLRRENQRLRTRVGDLERELKAARERIAELEREIAALRRQLASRPEPGTAPTATRPEPRVTVDESIPNASPRALLAAVKESYRELAADLPPGEPDSRERIAFFRALERWATRVNRELKSQIVWHVRLAHAPWRSERDARVELEAIDPETHVVLGDPVPVRLTRSMLRRLEQLDRAGDAGHLRLKGVLLPNVRINPDRETAGAFDKPRLIGPFAELQPAVIVSTITEVREEEEN